MRFLVLFLIFLQLIDCLRRLSSLENEQLKNNCGTKPPISSQKFSSGFMKNKRFIYGGVPISGNQAPWSVYLDFSEGVCSGTIISSRHILTATHCLQRNHTNRNPILQTTAWTCENNNRDLVYTQDHQLLVVYRSDLQVLSTNVVKVTMLNMCAVNNVDYDDIMIMELKYDIEFNDYAHPACIPQSSNFDVLGNWFSISAFGHNHWIFDEENNDPIVLRFGIMMIQSIHNDGRVFGAVDPRQQNVLRPGDSGGSAFSSATDNRYYLIGVCSGSSADEQYYSTFISVGNHYNQICFHTGIC
ncbi:hypothetical protein GCK72_001858 [Caenorhabditis remanei]|uniref:Peptidase S1 domain-containing protein n=1 Tax=Caenorhabditis remanei TaxID=31234 RepID=A0A6A5HRX6_CAERE|nr:hypothetical protein GCK72_001858 [Caenorhabditis remanei]KAF1770041.1 hypothetical protein GCK72_001858 [Caenorhabditis remanei]